MGARGLVPWRGVGARVHDLLAKTRGGVCAGGAPQTLGEKCTAGYARGAPHKPLVKSARRGMRGGREVIALRRVPFAEQLDALARVFSNDKVLRASLDQAGMGEAVVEQAQARHGKEYHISLFHGVKGTCSLAGCGAAPHELLAQRAIITLGHWL